jgi:hypothetical protein
MRAWWWIFAGSFSLLFGALIGLINLPLVDDSPLQAFVLEQAGCELPCWQGIQPGVSDVFSAIRVLQAHPWVDEIYPYGPNTTWGWSGQQPGYINPTGRGTITTDWDRVTSITIPTRIPFGEMLLAFDQPPQESYAALRGTALIAHTSVYPEFALYSVLTCPTPVGRIWMQPVTLIMELRLTERNTNQADFVDYQAPLWRREMSVCNQ